MPSRPKTVTVRVTMVDEAGVLYEGDAVLAPAGTPSSESPSRRHAVRPMASAAMDFNMPPRGFIKKHAKGLGGPKKFMVVLAFLAKGTVGTGVPARDIERFWNRMTAENLLGCDYHPTYGQRAKEGGWVNTEKHGVYVLRENWEIALQE